MAEQRDEDLFIASFAVAEIRRGVLEKPAGRRRDQLEAWFFGPEGPQALEWCTLTAGDLHESA